MSESGKPGRRDTVVGAVVFVLGAGASWLVFRDWDLALLGGSAVAVLWAVGALALFLRKVKRGEVKLETSDPVDWLALGTVEVRVEGAEQRYLATFTGGARVVESADRREQQVARLMDRVGMPPAVLTALDRDAPTIAATVVELPRM
ncbi:hypothetical protein [Catellatospora sp. TT07R-123]|uniref:hypothetical protein n=1 Tax=Catellatospora sp. TT07R-123 TaxID=2733863 RepID=UPI001BB33693|nr:hypothetical protein [Catellatospora sp. TT07R-123]